MVQLPGWRFDALSITNGLFLISRMPCVRPFLVLLYVRLVKIVYLLLITLDSSNWNLVLENRDFTSKVEEAKFD